MSWFDFFRNLFAIWGVISAVLVVGTLVFTFRLPRYVEDAPGTTPEPSNVRVICEPEPPEWYVRHDAVRRARGADGGAVRVDVAAWAFVLGLVALLAAAGWAS